MKNEEIELKIPKWGLEKDWEEIEYKLAHMLLEDVIFCNQGWWKKQEGISWPKDHVTLHVMCNDVFAWASADAEEITYPEISELYEMWKKDETWGAAVWCIKKRKQMPQKPVVELINKTGLYNLEELIK